MWLLSRLDLVHLSVEWGGCRLTAIVIWEIYCGVEYRGAEYISALRLLEYVGGELWWQSVNIDIEMHDAVQKTQLSNLSLQVDLEIF
jgi:hypothetical protein